MTRPVLNVARVPVLDAERWLQSAVLDSIASVRQRLSIVPAADRFVDEVESDVTSLEAIADALAASIAYLVVPRGSLGVRTGTAATRDPLCLSVDASRQIVLSGQVCRRYMKAYVSLAQQLGQLHAVTFGHDVISGRQAADLLDPLRVIGICIAQFWSCVDTRLVRAVVLSALEGCVLRGLLAFIGESLGVSVMPSGQAKRTAECRQSMEGDARPAQTQSFNHLVEDVLLGDLAASAGLLALSRAYARAQPGREMPNAVVTRADIDELFRVLWTGVARLRSPSVRDVIRSVTEAIEARRLHFSRMRSSGLAGLSLISLIVAGETSSERTLELHECRLLLRMLYVAMVHPSSLVRSRGPLWKLGMILRAHVSGDSGPGASAQTWSECAGDFLGVHSLADWSVWERLCARVETGDGHLTAHAQQRDWDARVQIVLGEHWSLASRICAARMVLRIMEFADAHPLLVRVLDSVVFRYLSAHVLKNGESCEGLRKLLIVIRFLACARPPSRAGDAEEWKSRTLDGAVECLDRMALQTGCVDDEGQPLLGERVRCEFFGTGSDAATPAACEHGPRASDILAEVVTDAAMAYGISGGVPAGMLRALVAGTWYSVNRSGAELRCKLVWVSSQTGAHVFVDASGQKVLELSRREVSQFNGQGLIVPVLGEVPGPPAAGASERAAARTPPWRSSNFVALTMRE